MIAPLQPTNQTATVLILGARGRFGLACARAFANVGWRVLGQIRPGAHPPADAQNDKRIAWHSMELRDTEGLVALAQGASVVVHALNPAYTDKAWKAEALPMAEAAIDISRALGATLMLPGNVYNFGVRYARRVAGGHAQRAATVKGQIRIGLEAQIQRSGVRAVVIRAVDFFGSGQGTWF